MKAKKDFVTYNKPLSLCLPVLLFYTKIIIKLKIIIEFRHYCIKIFDNFLIMKEF